LIKCQEIYNPLYTDKDHFVALCWMHHEWAEMNPYEAKEMGLSKNRL